MRYGLHFRVINYSQLKTDMVPLIRVIFRKLHSFGKAPNPKP